MEQGSIVPRQVSCGRCGRMRFVGDAFCPGCGASDGQNEAFRSMGRSTYSEPAGRSGLSTLAKITLGAVSVLILGALCLFALGFFGAVAIGVHNISQSDESGASRSTNTPRVFRVGQTIRVGYWTYRVNNVQYGSAIPDGLGGLIRPAVNMSSWTSPERITTIHKAHFPI